MISRPYTPPDPFAAVSRLLRTAAGHVLPLVIALMSATTVPCLADAQNLAATSVVAEVVGPHFSRYRVTTAGGEALERITINSPPIAPAGILRQAVSLAEPIVAASVVSLTVPAYDWTFGCSATSGAMIAAYYDRNGYPNIYTGPTGGGVMPLNNSVWGTWTDGNDAYGQNPLAASRNGLDGQVTGGSMDDYWVMYGSAAADPYVTGAWTQHAWGTAIGDYMKTSQSAWGNVDGSTSFTNFTSSASQMTCSLLVSYGATDDGTLGRKQFYEARGYAVSTCYNQKTDNTIAGGFSLAQYKAEIDASRPVMLNLEGHTVVGFGYDTASDTIYIHDTWDYLDHTMAWGGSYTGLPLLSVSIVNLAPPAAFGKSAPANAATGIGSSVTLSWASSGGAASYEYCIDTTNDNACTAWTSTGTSTSVIKTGLGAGTTYYWQARAINGGGTTYANGASTAFWSFSTPTPITPPSVTSTSSTGITSTGATLQGTMSSNGASTTVTFQYGLTTGYGSTAMAAQSPLAAAAAGTAVSAAITGLSCNTTYHYRVVGVNSAGTTNGADLTLVTSACSPVAGSLTVVQLGTGIGKVTSSPAGIDCGNTCTTALNNGTRVTLTATTPNPGSAFGGWSGAGCSGTAPTCTVTIAGAMSVTATFTYSGTQTAFDWVQDAYVAYYGRPADPPGRAYWAGRTDLEGRGLTPIIGAFGTSDEFNRRYGGLTNEQLVTRIYQQALARDPDAGGLAWYIGELEAGRRTLQTITLDVMYGATTPPDSTTVANKRVVANHYSGKVAAGCAYGTEITGFNALKDVTADPASVTAAIASIDARCATP